MAGGSDQEKTEKATPKKRQKARREGQIAKSREIPSVAILMSALGVFFFASSWMIEQLSGVMRFSFQGLGNPKIDNLFVSNLFWQIFLKCLIILAPLMFTVMVAGVASNVAQVGFLWTTKPLTPKFSKFNPLNGLKNLFSLKSLVEVVKSVVKLAIVGWVSYLSMKGDLDAVPALMHLDVMEIFSFIGGISFKICFYVGLVLIIIAGLDFIFQRWQHEKSLKMTKQEVKDENKQQEGDPQIRARIRSVQRQMAMQRMMEAVPDATVVITNPTHLAIAIKFEPDFPAPMVVAKGAGHVARRIREIAQENGVPIVEQKPLARTLFKITEIGGYIPVELYRAVAEVLAYVYRLKGLVKGA